MSEKTLRPEAALSAIAQVALIDILLDEDVPPRPDGVDQLWIAWLTDSIPKTGPPATLRGVSIWEGMRATA